jgi:hypothetical protein
MLLVEVSAVSSRVTVNVADAVLARCWPSPAKLANTG